MRNEQNSAGTQTYKTVSTRQSVSFGELFIVKQLIYGLRALACHQPA